MPQHVERSTGPVGVRSMVEDLDAAIGVYRTTSASRSSCLRRPRSTMLARGHVRVLLLLRPERAERRRPCPTGDDPSRAAGTASSSRSPDLRAEVERVRAPRARSRNVIVEGTGGDQILLEDPSGNAIEVFQDTR